MLGALQGIMVGFMNSKTWHYKNAGWSRSDGVLMKTGGFAKYGLSRNCGCIGAKQIKQLERKRYWPNTRPINGLIMGRLVVSKNQETRKVMLGSE